MKTQFDTFLEGQKKAMDFWKEASKKAVDQWSESIGAPKAKEDFLSSWFKSQKELWEEAMKVPNLQETFDQTPEQLQQWARKQTEMAQKWMSFYAENAEKLGVKIPSVNGFSNTAFNTPEAGDWNAWVDQSNKWIQDNILAKLPYPQGFHYQNFNELYEALHYYWEPLQQMMKHGITDWKGIEAFLKPQAYKEIVGQFMGFKPINDLSSMLEQANHYFEQYAEWLQKIVGQPEDWKTNWSKFTNFGDGSANPVFQAVMGINNTVREGLESLYNVAGQTREMEMAKLVKDIQFSYIAFILKTVDMQSRVFQAGQYALPDVIQEVYDKVKAGEQMPDYQQFFTSYINVLEKYMIEVLESKSYSVLQSEVAKAGVTVKSRLDTLVELSLADFPFLMSSHADEVALETGALRRKIRTLEGRLAELEAKLGGSITTAETVSADSRDTLLSGIGIASKASKDDLKKIKGIGPKLEGMLNSIGVYTFEQLSKMTEAHYDLVDELIDAFRGRARRDKWADQAKDLV